MVDAVRLSITSEKFIFSMLLHRRITYLRGDNSKGRGALLWFFENKPEIVSCEKKIKVLRGVVTWKEFEDDTGNSLFILDDAMVTERVGFSNSIVKNCISKDSYILVINRVEFNEDDKMGSANYICGIDCSAKEIYIMKNKGNLYWCEPAYMQGTGKFSVDNIDAIVTEDFHGMYDFCKSYFKVKVYSTTGKDKVLTFLVNNASEFQGKNILLFVDTASYGRYFDLLRSIASIFDFNINIDMNYECFEYFLLKSNMLNGDWVFSSTIANSNTTWEQYFEEVIESCTDNCIWKYRHGKHPRGCYLWDCKRINGCSPYVREKCEKRREDLDKLEYMYRGTEFEYILSLERKDKPRSVRELLKEA